MTVCNVTDRNIPSPRRTSDWTVHRIPALTRRRREIALHFDPLTQPVRLTQHKALVTGRSTDAASGGSRLRSGDSPLTNYRASKKDFTAARQKGGSSVL